MDIIKKSLDDSKWLDILPFVLWAYKITPYTVTKELPFSLCFKMEAMVPIELNMSLVHINMVPSEQNSQLDKEELNHLEERRRNTLLQLVNYQRQASWHYNSFVRPRQFKRGDLALRKVFHNTQEFNVSKLGPNQEVSYRVIEPMKLGANRLMAMDGREVPRSQHVVHLKKNFM